MSNLDNNASFYPEHKDKLIESTFPGSVEVAAWDAIILEWNGKCVKVYNNKFKQETINFYHEKTNSLGKKVNGKTFETEFPDASKMTFEIQVVGVDEESKIEDGRPYTSSRFVGGPTLMELNNKAKTAQSSMSYTNPDVFKKLYKYEADALNAIVDPLVKFLDDNSTSDEQKAIKIHPDNIKIIETNEKTVIYVTDISSSLSLVQENLQV